MGSTFTDNSGAVLDELLRKKEIALETIGLEAEGYAKLKAPTRTAVLKGSLTHAVRDDTVYIGTDVEYAPYVEFGTGIYAPGGRKDPWVYRDDEGKFWTTRGQPPSHFLQQAIEGHLDDYKKIAENIMKR